MCSVLLDPPCVQNAFTQWVTRSLLDKHRLNPFSFTRRVTHKSAFGLTVQWAEGDSIQTK